MHAVMVFSLSAAKLFCASFRQPVFCGQGVRALPNFGRFWQALGSFGPIDKIGTGFEHSAIRLCLRAGLR
jgi:hypothetical protein